MKLSILITLFNEELVLSQTHEAMSAQLEQISMMEVVTRLMN